MLTTYCFRDQNLKKIAGKIAQVSTYHCQQVLAIISRAHTYVQVDVGKENYRNWLDDMSYFVLLSLAMKTTYTGVAHLA